MKKIKYNHIIKNMTLTEFVELKDFIIEEERHRKMDRKEVKEDE